jgi:3-oxoacyl-[acyl-carrier-protein] synthase II
MRRRAVITGAGLVSPLGCAVEDSWRRLLAGESAVRTIQRFDASAFPSRIAADVRAGELPHESSAALYRSRGPIARYAASAAASALADARLLDGSIQVDRVGVIIAAGLGSYGHQEVFAACAEAATATDGVDWRALAHGLQRNALPDAAERRTPGSIAAAIAHAHGVRGPAMAVMTACAGGTQAIGDALRWIAIGKADAVVAGGADSELYPMGLASFCLLGALSRRNDAPAAASRPFDADRDGFVMGEGAAVLVLEEIEHARRRGAQVYAEVAGFGSSCDAYRATDPHPDGAGAALAMQRALARAGVTAEDVGYVNAHGTSTPANDRAETRAIRRVLGTRAPAVPISSTKSMIGHATVAAGAIEALICALTLRDQRIHPTINYTTPDPACDLDYVPNQSRRATVEIALSNSFAFGGQTACLALRRYHD